MGKFYLGFVGGYTVIDNVIKFATGAFEENITHVFIPTKEYTIEAEGIKQYDDKYPGVWKHPFDKYKDNPYARFVEIEVPDPAAGIKTAFDCVGIPYGYPDLASAELYLASGAQVTDDMKTTDCSALGTYVTRTTGVSVLPKLKVSVVSPIALYREAINKLGGVEVTWQQMMKNLQAQAA